MYKELRRSLAGSQDAKHSLNQRRLKRIVHAQRRYAKENLEPRKPSRSSTGTAAPVVANDEFNRLIHSGIFGAGANAQLEVAVHCVGWELNRVQRFDS
jgi:hypothetical protein